MAEKTKKRYGPWIILIVLLVALAGFGTGGLTGNIRSLGTVGNKDVSIVSYQRNMNAQIQALQGQIGTSLTFQQAQQFGIDQNVLNGIILDRTLDNEAAELQISVGDEQVLEGVKAIPQFLGSGGTFNRETYRYALQQNGQTEAQFETEIREEMSRNLLQAAVVSGIPESTAYADALVQYIGQRRNITWAAIDADALIAPVPGATEDAQQTYYDENPNAFTLPETRDITYVWLTPNMIQGDMVVSDESIAELYDTRLTEFVQPERRLVERLVYIAQEKADDARSSLDAGEKTFDELVTERGLSLSDIDLGDVSIDELGAAGEAVFAAEPGDVVGPFNTSLGPALFRMNATLAAHETSLEDATPQLREELANNAARRVISDSTEQVTDLLAGGATIEDLAERTDMQIGNINWTDDLTDGIAAYDSFRRAAASVQDGDFADALQLSDGGIFALRLDRITPPKLQPLDDVREDVIAAWQIQARQDAVMAQATEIASNIQPLTDFTTLQLVPQQETDLTRRSFIEGTPPSFNATIFEMNIGDVQVIDAVDRAIIVRLEDIAAPDEADETIAAQRESVSQDVARGIAQDIFDTYANTLRERTDVNINQATVDAVNALFQ